MDVIYGRTPRPAGSQVNSEADLRGEEKVGYGKLENKMLGKRKNQPDFGTAFYLFASTLFTEFALSLLSSHAKAFTVTIAINKDDGQMPSGQVRNG